MRDLNINLGKIKMEKILIPIREELMKKIRREAFNKGISPMNLILQTLNERFNERNIRE